MVEVTRVPSGSERQSEQTIVIREVVITKTVPAVPDSVARCQCRKE